MENMSVAHATLKRPWMGSTYFFDNGCVDVDGKLNKIFALHDARVPHKRSITFAAVTTDDIVAVTPYSECYHNHPHFILATSSGWKPNPSRSDFFTGKSSLVMKARRLAIRPLLNSRAARAHRKKVILQANEELAVERDALQTLATALQSTNHGALDHKPLLIMKQSPMSRAMECSPISPMSKGRLPGINRTILDRMIWT